MCVDGGRGILIDVDRYGWKWMNMDGRGWRLMCVWMDGDVRMSMDLNDDDDEERDETHHDQARATRPASIALSDASRA
jgi:hypothetical protein